VSKELKHQINLVLGDWSGDGHNQTATVTIRCNLDKKQLEKAYKAGCKKTGVNFADEVASDFEDNTISKEIVEKLAKHVFKIEDYSEDEQPGESPATGEVGYSLWTDGYAAAWMFIAKVGNSELEYEEMTDDSPDIHIGGYGLFYS